MILLGEVRLGFRFRFKICYDLEIEDDWIHVKYIMLYYIKLILYFSEMKLTFHLLLLFLIHVHCKTLNFFSSHKFGPTIYGPKTKMKDYVNLINDPKSNVPNMFTICSSVLIDFVYSDTHFIEVLKEDGSHWFEVSVSTGTGRHLVNNTLSEIVRIWYKNIQSEKEESDWLRGSIIPIVPHSWYHICMGLDTVSGLLRIALNGIIVVDVEKDYFKNTLAWKPSSLNGKIIGRFFLF